MKSKLKMLWLFVKRYKTRSIFMRDFIVVFLIVLVPIMSMGMFFYNRARKMTNDEVIVVNEANLKSCAGVVDSMLEEIDVVIANMSLNENVQLYTISERETIELLGVEEKVNDYIKDIVVTRGYMDSIYIYNDAQNLVFYQNANTDFDSFYDKNWYDSYKEIDDYYEQAVILRTKNNKYPQLVTFVRPICKGAQLEKTGAIVCNVNLEKLCKGIKMSDDIFSEFIIADNENNVVYSQNRALLGTKIVSDTFKNSQNVTTGTDNSGGNFYLSSVKPEKFEGWQYMLRFSTTEYEQKAEEVLYIARIVLLFCLIISLITAIFMTFKSFGLVSKIIDVIQKYTGNRSKDGFNEIDYIVSNIVSAMSMNEQLQNELLEQFNQLQDVQTTALQAQISPHFMRNTLSSINFKAFELLNGENEVSDMLQTFSNLMDCYVRAENYIVPMKTELENIELYAKLMNIRYGDKLKVNYNIPEEFLKYSIIKITLQPIVENSIMHGFKQSRSRGNITISAVKENENIVLFVDDDGLGMSDVEMSVLNSELTDMKSESKVGIHNVNKRYKIALGTEYGITVLPSKMGGLCVKITFPAMVQDA